MATKGVAKTTDDKARELKPGELRQRCNLGNFSFRTTDDVPPLDQIVGQERAIQALKSGLAFNIGLNPHANIVVTGLNGTGRMTLIKSKLEDLATEQAASTERVFAWACAYNFKKPAEPSSIRFNNGKAALFQKKMCDLLADLKEKVAASEQLLGSLTQAIGDEEQAKFNMGLQELSAEANPDGVELAFRMSHQGPQITVTLKTQEDEAQVKVTKIGYFPTAIVFLDEAGNNIPSDQINQRLAQKDLEKSDAWYEKVVSLFTSVRGEIARRSSEAQKEYLLKVTEPFLHALEEYKNALQGADRKDRPGLERTVEFLEGLAEYVEKNFFKIVQYEHLREHAENTQNANPHDDGEKIIVLAAQDPYLPFQINVLHEPEGAGKLPVVIETNPKYSNLFGRVDSRFNMGAGRASADHTMVRKGSIHAANGGFIIMDALALLRNPDAWEALKRTIKERRITISSRAEEMDFFRFDADLKPEPIPFRCKIVLVTTPEIYYLLARHDPDFSELFKIVAPFDYEMPMDENAVSSYVAFVSLIQHKKQLPPFTRGAVARIVEEGLRLAENKEKISTQFGRIEDVIAEAGNIAENRKDKTVCKTHVLQALAAQEDRSGLIADKMHEHVLRGMKLIDTSGEVVGQINALSVFQLPDGNSFGIPLRMTAQTFLGARGFVNIEREAKLSGPTYDKAFFTIQGYFGGHYGKTRPLAVSVSVAMEQSYGGIDGDSASLAGTAVITSALSGIPVKQSIAITGSMNQFGNVQPIGGVRAKIEGFFKVCKARGLDGTQGVIIPSQNVQQLMLKEEIVEAVRKGKFHVWAVGRIDEALTILMGKEAGEPNENGEYPADSIHGAAQKSLKEYLQRTREVMVPLGNNPELKQ